MPAFPAARRRPLEPVGSPEGLVPERAARTTFSEPTGPPMGESRQAQPESPPVSRPTDPTESADDDIHPMKSRSGLQRIWRATGYSVAGFRAAYRHEAAFRQELALAVPALVLALWLAPGAWQRVVLVGSILLVLIVELLNSGLESMADAVSTEHHPLLGRAKDMGSAAVMVSLLLAAVTWAVALWP